MVVIAQKVVGPNPLAVNEIETDLMFYGLDIWRIDANLVLIPPVTTGESSGW
jgi:hypothetical protein